jgi:hypothetical protein
MFSHRTYDPCHFFALSYVLVADRLRGPDDRVMASMKRASSTALLTVSTSALARTNLPDPLPVVPQLSLFVHAGHVGTRLADGAQRAAVAPA